MSIWDACLRSKLTSTACSPIKYPSLSVLDTFIPVLRLGAHGACSVKTNMLATSHERRFLAYVKAIIDHVIGEDESVGTEARPDMS